MYGVSFPDKKMMKQHEENMKKAEARDHRKKGLEQELFFFHQLSPGCAFFMPHGARLYNTLIDFIKDEYWKRGYEEVVTPNIFNADLWRQSGHWSHYKDDMFTFKDSDNNDFALKPMNCPGHTLIFSQRVRSWRELPLRLADFGVLHRNELSGALTGLTRVRRFQQDDAHIFCREDQIKEEVLGALDFMKSVYDVFQMSYKLELSTRPKKAVNADTPEGLALWDNAEKQLELALDEFGGKGSWRINPGDGAFYGPKIDIKVYDAMQRVHQCATVQLDFVLPRRFKLRYNSGDQAASAAGGAAAGGAADESKGGDGDAGSAYSIPVMVHRAMLGSVERMIAILTEHYGGKWPFWLNPRQIMIVPVHENHYEYAEKVRQELRNLRFFCDIDMSSKTMLKKIRESQVRGQYNYTLVLGDEEKDQGAVNVRRRGGAQLGTMSLADFTALCVKNRAEKTPNPEEESDEAEARAAAEAEAAKKAKGDAKGQAKKGMTKKQKRQAEEAAKKAAEEAAAGGGAGAEAAN